MLCMHFVHRHPSLEGVLLPLASVASNSMGMCGTPPRVMDESNCAEMRATRTWAVIEGTIFAVARSSSWVIWSLLLVPFLPRIAIISSIFLATFSSERTICSLGLTSCTTFSSLTRCTLTSFFLTFSKPSSSSESSAFAVFIHLLMPVAPLAPSSSLEDEEVDPPQSLSSSSSSSLSSSLSLPLAFFLASFFSSSLSLSDSSSLSLSSSSSLSSFSSSLSTAPFSLNAAMASS
mmetsp:Transcript_15690/g.39441  ORF Transcript_15690/g.39441 Transcript_15690/m.39441 type:complete len:233 (-) Transcript_15690:508-1206(-)